MYEQIWYGLIYLFEVLACLMFYENIYTRKAGKSVLLGAYALSFAIQFGCSFIAVPSINLVSFFVCNFLLTLICYEAKIKTCVFITAMLSFFMLICEIIIIYLSALLFGTPTEEYAEDLLVLITQSSLSKLLFFAVIFFASKIIKSRTDRYSADRHLITLSVLPLTSIVILIFLNRFEVAHKVTHPYDLGLTACSILLLFANLFVFYIYETVQKTNRKNTLLQLEMQKSIVSAEYYDLLAKEYESSRILIHDIKNHFQHISQLTLDNQPQEVIEYIDTLTEDYGLKERIKYSGNSLVDVIINRYATRCKEGGLQFEVEALCSRLEFMSDSDIISLLDNLLDNAYEAAFKSRERKISFSIYTRNSSFIVVSVINSCDSSPHSSGINLISQKKNPTQHGYGTKSIKRIAQKHNGSFTWKFYPDTSRFTATVIIEQKNITACV